MFQSTTPQALLDDINAVTDNDGYNLVSSAQLCAWINNELSTLWQWAVRCNRDAFTKCSANIQIASGGDNISMTAAGPTGAGITDWGQPRGVDILTGGSGIDSQWQKLKPWSFTMRSRIYVYSYKFMGDVLYLRPPQQASQYPVRVWYTFDAPQVSSSSLSTALSIPEGSDEYIKQGVAAKLRIRLDDDPAPHYQLQQQAKAQVEAYLVTGRGDQSVISDTSEESVYGMY